MVKKRKRLLIFCASLVFSMLFWRFWVFVFYSSGNVSVLRAVSGLNIHHYHYGMLFVMIASLLFMFYKVDSWSVGLMGFGLGSFFDGFASRLVKSGSRMAEINNYNHAFALTGLVFSVLILFSVVVYIGCERFKT